MGTNENEKKQHGYMDQMRSMIYLCCRAVIWIAVVVGAILVLIDAILYFGTSGDFTVREVVISGTHWSEQDEIQQLAELQTGANIWFVPSARVAQRIARHPWVRFCRVDKIPPDRVSIFVDERQPVCAFLDRRQGVLYGLDADCIVLPLLFSAHPNPDETIQPERLAAVRRLPFVTGPATVPVPGHAIDDSRYCSALKLLLYLRDLSPTFFDYIDSMHISEDGRAEVFPTRRVDRILFPAVIPETLPQEIIRIWDLIEEEQIDAEYIDARFPRAGVAIRPKHLNPGRWYELCRRFNHAA
ncbi:MAG: FtsQ-type POTRA domain-containing protein [bacterium]